MDDREFDTFARSLAFGRTRRGVLKGLLGIGAAALTGGVMFGQGAEAARRGFSGPILPTFTPCRRDSQGRCCASGVFEEPGRCCADAFLDSLGHCCDPTSEGAWVGCCCPVSPSGEVIGECNC